MRAGKRSEGSTGEPEARAGAARALVDEVVALFHRLRVAAAKLHGEGEASGARRGVLRGLARDGARTVPEMARERPVSRQHVQALVDALRADGLVELADNPAHRRSRLVRLTPRGEAVWRDMERVEGEVWAAATRDLGPDALDGAARTLRALRRALEDEASWLPAQGARPPGGSSTRRRSRDSV